MTRRVYIGILIASALSVPAFAVSAQEIVPAAPAGHYALAAGDVAVSAMAQVNDTANAANAAKKIELYKQLMELNGMSRNVRNVLASTKSATRLIVIDRAGADHLTPDQDTRYNQIADAILKDTESSLIDDIASNQAQSFSADEIQQLITANSSVAAAKYNAGKFQAPDANAQAVQTFMVDAVIKIIKSYTQSMAS